MNGGMDCVIASCRCTFKINEFVTVTHTAPPTIDPIATQRWQKLSPSASPWLHDEVARRMEERLQWMTHTPLIWGDWQPIRGSAQAHELIAARYPKAQQYVMEDNEAHLAEAKKRWQTSKWGRLLRQQPQVIFGRPADKSLDMLWANMALHLAADPQALLACWSQLIKPQGFVMFSCLGPDTVQELRQLYAAQGWPALGHDFTDMHDLGDMLVQHGFSEPVMDMERIQLRFPTAARMEQELRELGRNFHPQRFAGLRTPRWHAHWQGLIERQLMKPATKEADAGIELTFEIIYGHAFKAEPKAKVQELSSIALDDMRSMLRKKVQ